MKSIAELEAIKEKVLKSVSLRKKSADNIRIIVAMDICGIEAGARPVMTAFLEEIDKLNLTNVVIEQSACKGMCALEPIVEVCVPGKEPVTYAKVTVDKVNKIVTDHIVNGNPVIEYTVGAQE